MGDVREKRKSSTKMWAGAGMALIMAFSGCGAITDKAVERAFEEAVEAGIEADGGESVEIDFDAENGSISVTGEDGEEVAISIDEDEGSLTIEGGDEEVVLTVDDEEGSLTIEGDGGEGSASIQVGTDALAERWPAWMPSVDGSVVASSQWGSDEEGWMFTAGWEVADSIEVARGLAEDLQADGFTEAHHVVASTDGADTEQWQLTKDNIAVSIVATENESGHPLGVTINTWP